MARNVIESDNTLSMIHSPIKRRKVVNLDLSYLENDLSSDSIKSSFGYNKKWRKVVNLDLSYLETLPYTCLMLYPYYTLSKVIVKYS